MIDAERGLIMLAEANPVPDSSVVDIDVEAAAYLATLDRRSSEMTQVKTRDPEDPIKPTRNWTPVLVTAAVAILIGVMVVLAQDNQSPPPADTVPTTESETPDRRLEEALAMGNAMANAYAGGDVETMSDLAANTQSIHGFIAGSLEALPQEFAWREAVGWTVSVDNCEVTAAGEAGASVACAVSHSNAISEGLGAGPYEGVYLVRVGYPGSDEFGELLETMSVVTANPTVFPSFQFSGETWQPFMNWLNDNHPDDVQVMLGRTIGDGEAIMVFAAGLQLPATSPDAVTLWSQYSAEFIAQLDG